jgi:hypothetical protein
MQHVVSKGEYKILVDYTVENNLKSFKEEVLNHLYDYYKSNNMPLLFSGGMDSTFILRALVELGIKPEIITMSFSKKNNDYDCIRAKNLCQQYGVSQPEFIYYKKEAIFKHINELVYDRGIAYPMIHGFYMSYILKLFPQVQFLCGFGSEFKLINDNITIPYGPLLVKLNNPDRLFDFTTSRTFLSYLNHEQFYTNYKKILKLPLIERPDAYYVRNLIYQNCYPDIDIEEKKLPEDRYISENFYLQIDPFIRQNFPQINTPSFLFSIEDYLKRNPKEKNDC